MISLLFTHSLSLVDIFIISWHCKVQFTPPFTDCIYVWTTFIVLHCQYVLFRGLQHKSSYEKYFKYIIVESEVYFSWDVSTKPKLLSLHTHLIFAS